MNETLKDEKFDIFISYTHEDNHGIGKGAWVSEFKDDLSRRIKQRQGRPLNIYIDKSQTGVGGTLPELIENVLKNSNYLLPIVTPLYNESDWCELERVSFIEHNGLDEAMKRLVRVDKEPVEDVASELEDLKQYRFYHRDEGKNMDFVVTRDRQPGLYDELITELSLHILHEINAVSKTRDNTIYVANTSKKLRDKRSQISRELEQRGFNIVPASLGLVANKARDKARKNLEASFMSIHLIDEEFEPIFKGESEAIDRIQFEEAAKLIDEMKIFVWTPTNGFSDSAQQGLLEEVQHTNVTDLLHDFHEFKDEIADAAKEHRQHSERQTVKKSAREASAINVYLHYGPADEGADDVIAIAAALTAQGLEVFEPDFAQDDPHIYRTACSAIIYYFGDEPFGSVYYSIKTSTDITHECVARCICLKHGQRLTNPTTKALVINAHDTDGFTPGTLGPFFNAIGVTSR